MSTILEVKYYNSFWMKKVSKTGAAPSTQPMWPGLPWNPNGYPTFPGPGGLVFDSDYWYIEESRITGGYNNDSVSYGIKAFIVEDNPKQTLNKNRIIYSGPYSSRGGVNETNVFSTAEPITKSLNPANGSIQKLYAENTDLTIFQENKVSKALINKDAIYNADGDQNLTSTNLVIGQIIPYLGEYGISKNPEGFAQYGYRKYFPDKNRNAILRLSRDGITEISRYGMQDFFRDELIKIQDEKQVITQNISIASGSFYSPDIGFSTINVQFDINQPGCDCSCSIQIGSLFNIVDPTTGESLSTGAFVKKAYVDGGVCKIDLSKPVVLYTSGNPQPSKFQLIRYTKSKIVGGFDQYNKNYVISLQPKPDKTCETVLSREGVVGIEYNTLVFEEDINGWVSFYTYRPNFVDSLKNNYYSFTQNKIYKHYDQVNYNTRGTFYGVQNKSSITFILNSNPSIVKNFNTINYEGSNGWEASVIVSDSQGEDLIDTTWTLSNDSASVVKSYDEGKYTDGGVIYRSGFNRKENRYVANLINNSTQKQGEIIFGNSISGIKGYFATITIQTDETTELGGAKELFAVGSNIVVSSR